MNKSKNNIIENWLKEHGKPLEKGWFEKTTGCVRETSKFTEHETKK